MKPNPPVLLYDGFCFLCTSAARFLMRIDREAKIKLTPLQSKQGLTLLRRLELPKPSLDTLLLLHRGRLFKKSNAVFEILSIIGGPWRLLLVFKIVPLFIRDAVYDFISRNRYRWFGKKDSCEYLDRDRIQGQEDKSNL